MLSPTNKSQKTCSQTILLTIKFFQDNWLKIQFRSSRRLKFRRCQLKWNNRSFKTSRCNSLLNQLLSQEKRAKMPQQLNSNAPSATWLHVPSQQLKVYTDTRTRFQKIRIILTTRKRLQRDIALQLIIQTLKPYAEVVELRSPTNTTAKLTREQTNTAVIG